MKNNFKFLVIWLICFLAVSCDKENQVEPPIDTPEEPELGVDIIQLPVIVHVIHFGEEIGVGPNLSNERIQRQIEILNEDFRRKAGTKGYNDHPDGADTKLEFVLAKLNADGNEITGINRINASIDSVDNLGYNRNNYAQYAYWNPSQYINIWTTPLPADAECLVLGTASGPDTDLPGSQHLSVPQEGDAEGILINWTHFGESDIDCHARYGRTLTHEMGHYFGLLHPWGARDCELNDYCEDTPAVDDYIYGNYTFEGCTGEDIMIGNYMNFSDDVVMNIFTNDQTARIYYVLKNHSGRKSLMTSPALE